MTRTMIMIMTIILRAIMEMCITNQFVFPPPTLASSSEKLEEVRANEMQVGSLYSLSHWSGNVNLLSHWSRENCVDQ